MSKVLGAQLYTIRRDLKTPEDVNESFKKVREIGYTTIQASAIGAKLTAEELAAIARSNDLKIVITHSPYDKFVNDLDSLIKDHHTLGCNIVGLGSLPVEYRNEEGYPVFARQFAEIADELGKNGLKFSYHNHHFEFQKFNGKYGFDILVEETNPETFMFTLDTYWLQYAGVDPAAWLKKLKGRVDAVHFKDLAIIDDKHVMAEVLEGNLDWPAIFKASEEADVKWYLIERDDGPTEPFESLRISYNNLKKEGFA